MRRSEKYTLVALITMSVVGILILTSIRLVGPRQVFRQVVASSVPASVKSIRADVSFGMNERKYVLRFYIDEADLSSILAAPFQTGRTCGL